MGTINFAYDNRVIWRAIIISALVLVIALFAVLFTDEPTFPQWLYYLVVLAVPIYAYKLIRETLTTRISKAVPPAPQPKRERPQLCPRNTRTSNERRCIKINCNATKG